MLGPDGILVGDAAAERGTKDWSDSPASPPSALLMPRTAEQVSQVLRLCHRYGTPVAVQGGLTGLAGGANPRPGEVALSLARLNRIESFDEVSGTVIAQAGVTLEQLQALALEKGWFFPLDLGARGSCQLGGNAATNAGGNRVLRYGMMRSCILGLEAVLADGTMLTMLDSVIKNNAGYDLKQLFIGSVGTLGVITRLSLKLEPLQGAQTTVLCAVGDFNQAMNLLRECRRALPDLAAFELMWDDYFRASCAATGRSAPFEQGYPLYVLFETLSGDEATSATAVQALLETVFETGLVEDAIVAQSLDQAQQLWEYREGVAEILSTVKPCAAFDVSVAMPSMDELATQLRELLQQHYPDRQHLFFGHLGDGNLHLISGPYPDERDLLSVEDLVYRCVGELGGSISAEHGIGTVKKPFLSHSRSEAEIELMRNLKRAMDPLNILNPGRIFSAPQ